MGLSVNTNSAAMNAYRNLSVTNDQMSKSLERLSSGFRINRAADDAAGLAISEGLRSQIGGMKQAVRNTQDGISVVQVAEGALGTTTSILQRMRDLGVQAGNDSNNTEARAAIATEVEGLQAELARIAESTNFNGTKLLNGDTTVLNFQVGANGDAASQISVDLTAANVEAIADALGVSGGSRTAFTVATPTAVTGTYTFSDGQGASAAVDLGAVNDHTTVDSVALKLNQDSSFAASFRATVNSDNELVVSAKDGASTAVTVAAGAGAAGINTTGTAVTGGISFDTAADAQNAVDAIDTQLAQVSEARAQLGAYQNRFEYTINNLNVAIENTTASESRIRDTDMAQEMTNFTRTQILTQAGTSMLAQANQSSQGILRLLG
ncbi:flagellin [Geodermatophilus pulveris]|uniref:Flagellin n=1 Tax=Geodermatophilus pulveris TaxID=1564159 RepID=A0A239GR41_9ACTN|nr:flagellin [Geodermatophilus pulveris]SNS71335.1 flagellin [Geodermatophilus pulveris]